MGVGSNTKSSNPLLPVTWGSENTYRLLSSFRMWAESNIFLPVEENPVKIKIDVTDQIPINFPTCHECKLKLNQAGIVDAIKVVHWKQVHTFNLISIVRCKFAFVVVGTCVLYNFNPGPPFASFSDKCERGIAPLLQQWPEQGHCV